MPKFRQTLCEVCGEPVNPLSAYADKLKGKILSPREYVEYQLNMSEEEKKERQEFFEALFSEDAKNREMMGVNS